MAMPSRQRRRRSRFRSSSWTPYWSTKVGTWYPTVKSREDSPNPGMGLTAGAGSPRRPGTAPTARGLDLTAGTRRGARALHAVPGPRVPGRRYIPPRAVHTPARRTQFSSASCTSVRRTFLYLRPSRRSPWRSSPRGPRGSSRCCARSVGRCSSHRCPQWGSQRGAASRRQSFQVGGGTR